MTHQAYGLVPSFYVDLELNISNKLTHSITLEYKTDKELMWNYLIGFRANLEAALITDKRPKPRSDIEDAMIVVNTDVRQQ